MLFNLALVRRRRRRASYSGYTPFSTQLGQDEALTQCCQMRVHRRQEPFIEDDKTRTTSKGRMAWLVNSIKLGRKRHYLKLMGIPTRKELLFMKLLFFTSFRALLSATKSRG